MNIFVTEQKLTDFQLEEIKKLPESKLFNCFYGYTTFQETMDTILGYLTNENNYNEDIIYYFYEFKCYSYNSTMYPNYIKPPMELKFVGTYNEFILDKDLKEAMIYSQSDSFILKVMSDKNNLVNISKNNYSIDGYYPRKEFVIFPDKDKVNLPNLNLDNLNYLSSYSFKYYVIMTYLKYGKNKNKVEMIKSLSKIKPTILKEFSISTLYTNIFNELLNSESTLNELGFNDKQKEEIFNSTHPNYIQNFPLNNQNHDIFKKLALLIADSKKFTKRFLNNLVRTKDLFSDEEKALFTRDKFKQIPLSEYYKFMNINDDKNNLLLELSKDIDTDSTNSSGKLLILFNLIIGDKISKDLDYILIGNSINKLLTSPKIKFINYLKVDFYDEEELEKINGIITESVVESILSNSALLSKLKLINSNKTENSYLEQIYKTLEKRRTSMKKVDNAFKKIEE